MGSLIPSNKDDLHRTIDNSFGKLQKTLIELESFQGYDPTQIALVGQVKGTLVSVNHLLAYLLGWSNLVVSWLHTPDSERLLPSGYDFSSKSLGKLAQCFYHKYAHLDYDELKQQLQNNYNSIKSSLDNITNEKLYEKPFYKKYSLGRMVDLNTRCPLININKRLRAFKKQLN